MYVDSLNKMEEIVSSREDLIWENFNVVQLKTKTPNAALGKSARFIKDAWWKVKVYPLTEDGWKVPDKWVS